MRPFMTYRLLQKRGIGRDTNVAVMLSTYGTQISCTLDAIAKSGATARWRRSGRHKRRRRRAVSGGIASEFAASHWDS